ncbi:hypothetical protein [Streptomyces sp. NPDC029526]|uniref:hypothetical protein n=1 Tax=Streptomyces sp. NPDC029526 TaxID=3155728 RepID=UPI0033F2F22F
MLTAVACGSDDGSRDYSVPSTFCGTRVDAEELTPFLPPGRRIAVEPDVSPGTAWCDVSVDGKLAVRTVQTWWQGGRDTAHFLRGQTLREMEASAENGRFVYSGTQGFGKTKGCVDEKYGQELYTGFQVFDTDHEDADAMKRLIVSFTERVERSDACDGPSE